MGIILLYIIYYIYIYSKYIVVVSSGNSGKER